MKHGISIFLLLCVVFSAVGQENPEGTPDPFGDVVIAYFQTRNLTPRIGDPIMLTLYIEIPPGVEIIEWPQSPDDWGDFSVVSRAEPIFQQQADGSQIYEQQYDIRLWKTGDLETPAVFLSYQVLGQEDVYSVPVSPAYFSVPSVLETTNLNALTLKPSRRPIGFFVLPWWVVLMGIAAATGAAWIIRKRYDRWRDIRAQRAVQIQPTPGEIALDRLTRIKSNGAPSDLIYVRVSDILRDYLAGRFSFASRDLTTTELIQAAETSEHAEVMRIPEMKRVLEQTDLVKFATAQPAPQTAERIVNLAQRWVTAVEQEFIDSSNAAADKNRVD